MKKFTIFGNPVKHSISPALHNSVLKHLKLEGVYNKTQLDNGLDIKKIFLANYDGANVTVPFKEIAYNLCDEVKGIAREIKAVNTLVKENGKMIGYNTDAPGFFKSIEDLNIKSVLVLGAGGSSKAIASFLSQNNINVMVTNRSSEKLIYFKKKNIETSTWIELDTTKKYDIVINTTSAGLNDNNLPLEEDTCKKVLLNTKLVYDIIYNKETPFLSLSKNLNIKSKSGKDMLLYQAVLAFNIFYNNKLVEKEIYETMKKEI